MKRIWSRFTSSDKTNQQNNTLENESNHEWSDSSLSTHLPIYKINRIASSNTLNDNTNIYQYNIPQILYNSISDEIDCVLLGESTHGTKEFYQLRSIITKHLIVNKNFTAIFIEMDWPKAYILNEYILLNKTDSDINTVFNQLKEYPLWMYRNNIIKELVLWLHDLNISFKKNGKPMINLYGIDMQSYASLDTLKTIYNKHKSFLPHSTQILSILHSIKVDYKKSALNKLQNAYKLFLCTNNDIIKQNKYEKDIMDFIYNIDQNFITLKSAINYFGGDYRWDTRDNHWFDSMEKYFYYKSNCKYLGFNRNNGNDIEKGKIILWAHNSHVCNADYVSYSHSNIGSFVKNKYGQKKVFTICFDTFKGNVTATENWDELPQFYDLNDNVKQSYGYLWHDICGKYIKCNECLIFLTNGMNKLLEWNEDFIRYDKPVYIVKMEDIEKKNRIRDIGVCYENSNSYSHCTKGNMLEIADVLIFVDNSNALEPFDEDKHKSWNRLYHQWHKNHSKL